MSSAQLRAAGVITSDGAAAKTHDETLAEASAAAAGAATARWREVAAILASASAVDHRDRLHELKVTRVLLPLHFKRILLTILTCLLIY